MQLKSTFALAALVFLGACASSQKNSEVSGGEEIARNVAQEGQCVFDLDETSARRLGIQHRKALSWSSGDAAELQKLPKFYKDAIEHYMRTVYRWHGKPNELFEDYLSGDGGFIQRIVWGKGVSRKTYLEVSHYPGDNYYGAIFPLMNGRLGSPVLKIEDGDPTDCRVFVPARR